MKVNVYKYGGPGGSTLKKIRENAEMSISDIKVLMKTPNLIIKTTSGEPITSKNIDALEFDEMGGNPPFAWSAVGSDNKPTAAILNKPVDQVFYSGSIGVGSDTQKTYENLETVTFSNTLTKIPPRALCGTSITEVSIPLSVKEIGEEAFSGTSISEIAIPKGVEKIGKDAFYNTSLSEITLPEGLKEISGFRGLSLTSVEFPTTTEIIGNRAFAECSSLSSISLNEGLKEIGEAAFQYCPIASLELPSTLEVIKDEAFAGNPYQYPHITELEIPASVRTIGSAFSYWKNLETVVLNEGISEINRSFADCSALETINFPSSLKTINTYAFSGCGALTTIELNEGLVAIELNAFGGCTGLTEIEIPESVDKFGPASFYGCSSLEKITFKGIPSEITPQLYDNQKLFGGCASTVDIYWPGDSKPEGGDGWFDSTTTVNWHFANEE